MNEMKSYDFKSIESKWNRYYNDKSTFLVDVDKAKNPYYCLDMFPYPSGKGLHVGHWRGYVLSDFYARYQRLLGKDVLHPMGFDAFGLPAENAAIKNKSHPKLFTDQAIEAFTAQLKQMASSFDWSKKVVTSDHNYYRWTQWLFLQLYKHGMAEKRISQVNWCPKDQTVLANEQVVSGTCERCGTQVTKKELAQWYFLTTKYSQELLDGLDTVDWPERVKSLQRNWIGRSEGAEVVFGLERYEEKITVFTTRPDTIMGVTALVLAPEHPLVKKVVKSNKKELDSYLRSVASKTNIDRAKSKETSKTAFFTGLYALHPLTNEKIPIWLADYVLLEYGTGAVMSVPGHDERDYDFAIAHDLPIKEVVTSSDKVKLPYTSYGTLINSLGYNGLSSEEGSKLIVQDLTRQKAGKATVAYRLRDWLVSRQRYWGALIPIVYDPAGKAHPVKEEHLPLLLPEDVDFLPGGESPIARSKDYKKLAEKLYGKGWRFETDTLDTFVDSSWYFLRYLTPNDSTKAFDPTLVNRWLPVDLYVGGIEHATLHLLYARFITRFLSEFGYIDHQITEPFQKLFNIGMITMHGAKMSKSKGNVVSPDPLIEHYGTDALRGYELFIGPADLDAEWNPRGINGVHKFLIRLNTLRDKIKPDAIASQQSFNTYLTSITAMIDDFKLNTVVAEAMKLINELERSGLTEEVYERFLITLSPIFPYICEELYSQFGHDRSILDSKWPTCFEIAIQKSFQIILQQGKKAIYLGNVTKIERSDQKLIEQLSKTFKEKIVSNKQYRIVRGDDRIILFHT